MRVRLFDDVLGQLLAYQHVLARVYDAALKTSACKNCTCGYYSGALSNSSEIHNCSACSCGRDTTVYPALDSLNIEASFVSFA